MNEPIKTSRLCKYHGRTCEHPGACLNRSPRKYEGDGAMEHIDPERLTIGNVIRMNQRSGLMHAFSDSVVIGIKVQYGTARRKTERQEFVHHNTLAEAQAHATKDDWIVVIVARPYLDANNAFGSIPNYMIGAERHEVYGVSIIDSYKVVVNSTGEYANYMTSPLLHSWEVVVKNDNGWAPKDGKVYRDLSEGGARESYRIHRAMAQGAYGRKGGETVQLFCDGVIVDEYVGNMGTE